jgi:hypothetical protein
VGGFWQTSVDANQQPALAAQQPHSICSLCLCRDSAEALSESVCLKADLPTPYLPASSPHWLCSSSKHLLLDIISAQDFPWVLCLDLLTLDSVLGRMGLQAERELSATRCWQPELAVTSLQSCAESLRLLAADTGGCVCPGVGLGLLMVTFALLQLKARGQERCPSKLSTIGRCMQPGAPSPVDSNVQFCLMLLHNSVV